MLQSIPKVEVRSLEINSCIPFQLTKFNTQKDNGK